MSDQKKYVTFRDLRAVSSKSEPPPPEPNASSSTPSITSDTSISSTPSISSVPSTPSTPDTTPIKNKLVAPERDFQRVPNSVVRQAIPEGLFRGKSKQVWDYLWSVSRGAVVPKRTVRKSRREIKAGAGLGSMVTVDAAIVHLTSIGLIAVSPAIGSFTGNEYEVFTPEEAASTPSIPSSTSSTSLTQKLVYLDIPETSISSITQIVEDKGSYEPPKTSFKTKDENDDDEALAEFGEVWKKAVAELTGRGLSKAESSRWKELAEVLVAELKIAAARTTVSSVPAFLAEHLRRRLWKLDKKQARAEGKELPDQAAEKGSGSPVKDCPDCGGSGFWYPEGYDKGVMKCSHANLKPPATSL